MKKICNLMVALAIPIMVSALQGVQNSYHTKVGIPLAKRIKEAEAKMMASNTNRLVDAPPAPPHAYPYLAGLLIDLVDTANISACGSSLLTGNRLVTAAHCWSDKHRQAYQFTVIMGSNTIYFGGVRIVTRDVIIHPEYNRDNLNNDIAMIALPTAVDFNDFIHPIDLPSGPDLTNDFVGQEVVIAGFGGTGIGMTNPGLSPILNHMVLRVITNEECLGVYKHELVPPSKLCTAGAVGVGTCYGDSGSPLVYHANARPILIGILSFGSDIGCALGHPTGFTRVTDYYDYIQQHL